ncbi:hypothetical protein ACFE04_018906 [Oxalis oulophora]
MIPGNITWDRITAPPFDNPVHLLHICHCLRDLKLGDHIEIQWRLNNDISYGEPIRFLKLLVDKKRYIIVAECFTGWWRTSLEDLMSIHHGKNPGSYTIDCFSEQLERQSSKMETMRLPDSIDISVSEKLGVE